MLLIQVHTKESVANLRFTDPNCPAAAHWNVYKDGCSPTLASPQFNTHLPNIPLLQNKTRQTLTLLHPHYNYSLYSSHITLQTISPHTFSLSPYHLTSQVIPFFTSLPHFSQPIPPLSILQCSSLSTRLPLIPNPLIQFLKPASLHPQLLKLQTVSK